MRAGVDLARCLRRYSPQRTVALVSFALTGFCDDTNAQDSEERLLWDAVESAGALELEMVREVDASYSLYSMANRKRGKCP